MVVWTGMNISEKTFLFLLSFAILITTVSGCDRYQRHKVLTFFFTGVPPLDSDEKATPKIVRPLEETLAEKKKKIAGQKLFSHPVYAAQQCNQCHRTETRFNVPGQKRKSTVFRKGGGMPGGLLLPRERLCIKCHQTKSPESDLTQGLFFHPTSAKGECHRCHDPHQSGNIYLLLKKPDEICFPCHSDNKLACSFKAEFHSPRPQKSGGCLACHNPHMGINRLLLTKDFQEAKKTAVRPPGVGGFENTTQTSEQQPIYRRLSNAQESAPKRGGKRVPFEDAR